MNEDRIASDCKPDSESDDKSYDESDYRESVVNANYPVWDPREYFLLVVEKRMTIVQQRWERVVQMVEPGITKYVC